MRISLQAALDEAASCLAEFKRDPAVIQAMNQVADLIAAAFRAGNKVMCCGNGGSMADAMHIAEEFTGRFRQDRRPYPAFAFCDPTHLTCVANDYGFDQVFSRMVEAFAKPGDVLILLSTSGNSPNLLEAAAVGKKAGTVVVSALGPSDGKLAGLCDVVLRAPGNGSDRIQELHMLAFHAIIEAVEKDLGH